MSVTINVKMNKLPQAQANLRPVVEQAGEKYLDEVDRIASGLVPVDTGNLKNSKTRAKGRIAWTAEYAVHVNFGTYKMAAQPFATDASEKALPQLQQALAQIEGGLLA